MTDVTTYRTGIGASDLDSITLLGHDLAGELLGVRAEHPALADSKHLVREEAVATRGPDPA